MDAESSLSANSSVLVHCRAGISRSATFGESLSVCAHPFINCFTKILAIEPYKGKPKHSIFFFFLFLFWFPVLAYLIESKKYTLYDAFDIVRSHRPFIMPNTGFWRQLAEFERKTLGTSTSHKIEVGVIAANPFHSQIQPVVVTKKRCCLVQWINGIVFSLFWGILIVFLLLFL